MIAPATPIARLVYSVRGHGLRLAALLEPLTLIEGHTWRRPPPVYSRWARAQSSTWPASRCAACPGWSRRAIRARETSSAGRCCCPSHRPCQCHWSLPPDPASAPDCSACHPPDCRGTEWANWKSAGICAATDSVWLDSLAKCWAVVAVGLAAGFQSAKEREN